MATTEIKFRKTLLVRPKILSETGEQFCKIICAIKTTGCVNLVQNLQGQYKDETILEKLAKINDCDSLIVVRQIKKLNKCKINFVRLFNGRVLDRHQYSLENTEVTEKWEKFSMLDHNSVTSFIIKKEQEKEERLSVLVDLFRNSGSYSQKNLLKKVIYLEDNEKGLTIQCLIRGEKKLLEAANITLLFTEASISKEENIIDKAFNKTEKTSNSGNTRLRDTLAGKKGKVGKQKQDFSVLKIKKFGKTRKF